MYHRTLAGLALLFPLSAVTVARAQDPPPVVNTEPAVESPTTPAPMTPGSMILQATKATQERPGRFRIGPMYLTPHIRLGSIGLDTNVFYSATDRQTDVRGSVGPGLDMVIPLGSTFRLTGEGGLDYIYFVRTESQRHLMGFGGGGLEWSGARTEGGLLGRYAETFDRLSTEVNQRIQQRQRSIQLRIHRKLAGRTGLDLLGSISRQATPGTIFLGTDLGATLTSDTYGATGGLDYALTSKTRFLLQGGADDTRFPRDPSRNAVRPQVSLGLQSYSILSGRAIVGVQWFQPADRTVAASHGLYADVDVLWHVSARTGLGVAYSKDIGYTAFVPVKGAPIVRREKIEGSLRKDLFGGFDLRLLARRTHTRTDNPVRLTLSSGETIDIRNDVSYEYTGELGFRVAARLWIGGTVGYGQRRSNVSDLGIEGLLLGGKITFTP